MYIRPVKEDDIDALFAFLKQSTAELTSLPKDKGILTEKIAQSIASEKSHALADWQRILMILYDTGRHCIAGISGLEREKSFAPHYTIDQGKQCLRFETAAISPIKLGSLLLRENYRNHGLGGLLSKSRFLYLANFTNPIADYIHAELRGWVDTYGESPFWKIISSAFYGKNFSAVDQFRGSQPEIFAEYHLAAHDIPYHLVGQDVEKLIGKVHADTENALRMLEKEGFSKTSSIDILDGGPILKSAISNIFTIKNSIFCPIMAAPVQDVLAEQWMISNSQTIGFRAALRSAQYRGGYLFVHPQTLTTLELESGDLIRAIPKNPVNKR